MSRFYFARHKGAHRFPRVSGDEPFAPPPMLCPRAFSPRERG